jgi:hypothetical protein
VSEIESERKRLNWNEEHMNKATNLWTVTKMKKNDEIANG